VRHDRQRDGGDEAVGDSKKKERGEAGKRKRVRRWEIRTEAEIESE
jgi:hypothetical protein